VLSHWIHVATQVVELVAELVFAMYFNGTVHTGHLLSNKLPTHFRVNEVICSLLLRRLVMSPAWKHYIAELMSVD